MFHWKNYINKEIILAINQARKKGVAIEGPISPIYRFSKVIGKQYDIVVVTYDQEHIPIKVTGFKYN